MVKKIIIDIPSGKTFEEEMSADELQLREADAIRLKAETDKHYADIEASKTLKASAKAKLMSGEALTEDEANTIVI